MIRRPLLIPLIGTLIAITSCNKKPGTDGGEPDDPTEYTLKLKKTTAGTVVRIAKKQELTDRSTMTSVAGQPKEKSQNKSEDFEYTKTLIAVDPKDQKATKFDVVFSRMNAVDAGKNVSHASIVGPKITATKKAGKFEFTANQKLLPADIRALDEEFNKPDKLDNEDMLPKKAVRVNETWDIDPKLLAKTIGERGGPPFDYSRATFKGKLARAYKKDDKQYGVIELTMEIPFQAVPFQGATILEGSKLSGTLSVDCCFDGSIIDEHLKGTVTIDVQLSVPGGKVRSEAKVTSEGSQTEVKK